jgi:hypothetical protein
MDMRPAQTSVTASPQSTIPGQVSHLLLDFIAIAIGLLPFFGCQPFSSKPKVWLIIADVNSSSLFILDALGF